MKTILKLNNISYSYDKKVDVLSNINLEIHEGEDVAIIGHNGSGKSTLAKIMLALLKAKSGTLEFNDEIINEKNVNLLRTKTGLVFQNPDNQFIGATVEDDIAFGLENRNINREKMQQVVRDFARKVGVIELLNKAPEYLSGGQKQRVAIAGILAIHPDLIIFDEALTMLDPKGKNEISNLISQIKKDNPSLTIIRITHDLDETLASDRLIVLDKGRIYFDDAPKCVFSHIQELTKIGLDIPFVVKLSNKLKAANLIKEDIYSMNKLLEALCK